MNLSENKYLFFIIGAFLFFSCSKFKYDLKDNWVVQSYYSEIKVFDTNLDYSYAIITEIQNMKDWKQTKKNLDNNDIFGYSGEVYNYRYTFTDDRFSSYYNYQYSFEEYNDSTLETTITTKNIKIERHGLWDILKKSKHDNNRRLRFIIEEEEIVEVTAQHTINLNEVQEPEPILGCYNPNISKFKYEDGGIAITYRIINQTNNQIIIERNIDEFHVNKESSVPYVMSERGNEIINLKKI